MSKINERTRQVEGVKKMDETLAKFVKMPKYLDNALLARRLLDEGPVKLRAKDNESDKSLCVQSRRFFFFVCEM